jgi:hypothetical protein
MLGRILLALVLSTSVAAAHDKYPMTGADYRKRIDEKLARYRDRLETRMTEHKLAAAKRVTARKRLAVIDAELRTIVERIAADGTVSEAEANEVKTRGKLLRDTLYHELGFERAKGE